MSSLKASVICLGLATLSLTACGALDPVICTLEARPGLRIEVFDAVDGAPVAVGLAGYAVQDSATHDLAVRENHVYGLWEAAGTYAAVLTAPGYRPWLRSGIEVTEGECHVKTVDLRAEMLTVLD